MDIVRDSQDAFKMSIKLWLRRSGLDYAWLAEHCMVSVTTVRNWMARKHIPVTKVGVIRSLMDLPPLCECGEKTILEVELSAELREKLQRMASQSGLNLPAYVCKLIETSSEKLI